MCGGIGAGVDGAVHALNELFEENCKYGWSVLMVDAANTFNSLNQIAALWNVWVLWPRCSRVPGSSLIHIEDGLLELSVGLSYYLYSKEGITQENSLSMFIYAVSSLPLIFSLDNPNK